jgi:hypothetical protein
VPADLQPSLAAAANDEPTIYRDGCHLGFPDTDPLDRCQFGDTSSPTTVVLVGDSLAAQWFPALDALATSRHWRLQTMTKSACTAVDVTVWSGYLRRAYSECDTWRQNVVARIVAEHPALVVVSDDRLYQLAINGGPVPVSQATDAWNAGLVRTLKELRAGSSAVELISSTPRSRVVPPACLAAHMTNVLACATPRKQAIDDARIAADRAAATASGAAFLDPSPWVCPSDPCMPIMGHLLVYREQDHLTATFVDSLEPRLAAALPLH